MNSKKMYGFDLVILVSFIVLVMSPAISVYGLPNTWTPMAPTPTDLWYENGLVWTGGDYIYAGAGLGVSPNFFRYSISGNTWTTLTAQSYSLQYGTGQDIVWTGGDYIYKLAGYSTAAGANTTEFARYSISLNSWTTLADIPVDPWHSALVWGGGDFIYALDMMVTPSQPNDFYRYSISGNSWTAMANPPGTTTSGSSMSWTGGDYIYALGGSQGNAFWRYSMSGDSWTTMANVPMDIHWAGSLAYDNSNYIYAWGGWTGSTETNGFWRYSISEDSWETLANTPNPVEGGGLCNAGSYIYGLRGASSGADLHDDFWRYEPPAPPAIPPVIESCDSVGTKKDSFLPAETVYANGSGFDVPWYGASFDLYIVNDVTWVDGMAIPARIAGTTTAVTVGGTGIVPATTVWSPPLTIGEFDMVVDVNGNGNYDVDIDALDDNDIQVTAGFLVIPEYWLGTLLGLVGMFAAFGTFYYSKHKHLHP